MPDVTVLEIRTGDPLRKKAFASGTGARPSADVHRALIASDVARPPPPDLTDVDAVTLWRTGIAAANYDLGVEKGRDEGSVGRIGRMSTSPSVTPEVGDYLNLSVDDAPISASSGGVNASVISRRYYPETARNEIR